MSKKPKIGELVKAFRMEHLLTQEQASERLGVSIATVKRIEGGQDCGDLTRAKILKLLPQGQAA